MPYVLEYKEGGIAKKLAVEEHECMLGRAPECNLILAQAGISRNHCKIVEKEDQFLLEDLNSKNGTRVNGVYVKTVELSSGDIIQIGEYQLRFQCSSQTEIPQQVVLSEEKGLQEEA